ncbi:non-specific lipid transfer protein GPI-anchored 11-like [Nymphaea colorata]|nr:non-specific lipid transfer protein GPI-anchored 11-like [Nymphaea colorata]
MASTRAAMAMLVVVGLVVAVAKGANEAAPAPSPDCNTVLVDMSPCLSFVQNGSQESKPEEACCQGLKTVIKKSEECLCEVLKSGGSLGIALNLTRATELPAACKVTAPPALKACAGFGSPAPSPPPKSSSSPKAAPSPKATSPTLPPSASAPATAGSNLTQSPAPSPAQSGAHAFLPSSLMFCAAMAMIWLSI